MLVSTHA
jgi:hypothetical protein